MIIREKRNRKSARLHSTACPISSSTIWYMDVGQKLIICATQKKCQLLGLLSNDCAYFHWLTLPDAVCPPIASRSELSSSPVLQESSLLIGLL